MSGLGLGAPADLVGRLQALERRGEFGRRRVDRKVRAIDPSEVLGARIRMHERDLRRRDVEQRIALRRHLAEPPPHHDDEIGRLDARQELRVRADAEVAGVRRMQRVEQMEAAERGDHRQSEALGEALNARAGTGRPAAAAEDHERPRCGPDQLLQPRHFREARPGLDRLRRRHVGDRNPLGEHVLGQRDDDRSRPPAGRGMERARDDLRDPRRIIDLGRPLGHRAEHGAIVELLERVAPAHLAPDLADEQDHRRGILLRDVDAGGRIGGAGSTRHEGDARTPGELADRLRHHGGAAFLAADRDGDVAIVESVEHRQIAFSRNAEYVADPLQDQLVDEDLRGGPRIVFGTHQRDSMGARGTFFRLINVPQVCHAP